MADTPRLVALRGDEADLFHRHHTRLVRAVRAAVGGPDAVIEDACQIAWTKLMRCQPRRETAFAWLRVVAVREAWRLSRAERDHDSLDATAERPDGERSGFVGGWEARADNGLPLEDELEARRALRALASLPDRQRRVLAWRVAGYSYAEIQALARDTTYTNVNKQLVKARRRLRQLEQDAA